MALDDLLLKVMKMDSLYLFRLNSDLLNNNAMACYEQMILALTLIHLQRLGLPQSVAEYAIM
eukprot:7816561-Ditylum_brightwellii.AAC.1